MPIPGGIFSQANSQSLIEALPNGVKDVGSYIISLSVTDSLAVPIIKTFTVTVPNSPPKFIDSIPDIEIRLNSVKSIDLS